MCIDDNYIFYNYFIQRYNILYIDRINAINSHLFCEPYFSVCLKYIP